MGHLAYSWLWLQMTPSASQVGSDKTLKHCQCVWISLILLAQWAGTEAVSQQGVPQNYTHLHTQTTIACLKWGWRKAQRQQNVLLPFACDFGGLKSAIRVFSKYTNTYLGLPRLLCSAGKVGSSRWHLRVGSAYVKLPPSLCQCETWARALARSMILVDYFDLASTSRGIPN